MTDFTFQLGPEHPQEHCVADDVQRTAVQEGGRQQTRPVPSGNNVGGIQGICQNEGIAARQFHGKDGGVQRDNRDSNRWKYASSSGGI